MSTPALEPTRHALLSPSSSSRWTACTGSAALIKRGNYKDQPGLPAAAGTFLHGIAAKALWAGKPAEFFIGEKGEVEGLHFTLGEKEAKTVQTYIDTVYNYARAAQAQGQLVEVFIEQELDIGWLTGEKGAVGTADCVIVAGDELIVVDFKTGAVAVNAYKNSQLGMYAAAALRAHEKGLLKNPIALPWVSAGDTDVEDLL